MRWIKNTFIIPETIGPYDKSSIMYNETLRLCPACEVRIDSHKTVLQSLATLCILIKDHTVYFLECSFQRD